MRAILLRVIQAFGLTSKPRKARPPAVDDVSFEARAGRVTALLGAPGAGKTTVLRLMLELQHGRGITYFRGRPLHRVAHPSREVGVLLGDVPGHPARTVLGHLRMLCAAVGVPVRRADDVLEALDLTGLRDERIGTLSRGMDRRLGLACALLADPHTLVLDDPAGTLSARDARRLHGALRAHAEQGGAVLFATADPKEAARAADHVVTLEKGRVVADQEAADFSRTRLRPRVAVRSPHAARLGAFLAKEARAARRSVEVVQESGNRLAVYGSTCADIGEIAFRHGILVHQLADEIGDMGPGAGAGAGAVPVEETGPAERGGVAVRDQHPGARPGTEAAASATGASALVGVSSATGSGPSATEAATSAIDQASSATGVTSSAIDQASSATGVASAPTGQGAGVTGAAPSVTGPGASVSGAHPSPADADASTAGGGTGADPAVTGTPSPATTGTDLSATGTGPSATVTSDGPAVEGEASAGADDPASAPTSGDPATGAGPSPAGAAPSAATTTPTAAPVTTDHAPAAPHTPAEVTGHAPETTDHDGTPAHTRAPLATPDTTTPPSPAQRDPVGTPETATSHRIPGPAAAPRPTDAPPAHRTPRPRGALNPGGAAPGRTPAPLPPPISVRSAPSPLRPLRYELRRATGIRTGFLTGAVVLLVSAVTAVIAARVGHTPQPRLLAAWPRELPLPPAALGAGLLGALAFGDEFRHPALAADRGTVPRRLGLLTAKLVVSAATALLLAALTAACDAGVLHLFYGQEIARIPADWPVLGAGWLGLCVGCAWAGLLAAGIFRSTTAGLAAVVAVPVLVVPLVQEVWEGPSVRSAAGLPVRLREVLLTLWPFGGQRYLAEVLRVIAEPVGSALTLSLTALLCAYLLMTLRTRAR
ncbi:ATP-binding cassette domain-containing protein [Streptomyces sp. NPDC004783]|uniref:ATP-binding cassette domain-containing protein n=1 Tax=Streptomyces sp. NPDC004783 TaxID=3154459 RepID=UPI0033A37F59